MKRFLFIFSIFISINTGAQVTFERTYGGTGADIGNGITGTADGGYLIVGSTTSFGIGMYVVRVDSVGDTLWTKIYQGSGSANGYSVDTTSNGFIITGSTNSFGAGGLDILLIRIDSSGDTLWTRTFGGISNEKGTDVIANLEGGYTVAGNTSSYGAGSTDVVVIKTDATGDTLWTRTYGLSNAEAANAISQTSDSGFVIAGMTSSFNNGACIFIIRINSLGDTLWTKVLEGWMEDRAYDIIQTSDGGYAICGYGDYNGPQRLNLIKLNQTGSVQWAKSYLHGSLTWGRALNQMPDGTFIISGFANSGAPMFFLKVNQFGNIIWSNAFDPLGSQDLFGMELAKDGGFCMVGITSNGGVYLVKVDSLGEGGCNSVTTNTSEFNDFYFELSGCLIGSGLLMSYAPLNVLTTNTIVGDPCGSGIDDLPNFVQPKVYPNPTTGFATITNTEQGIMSVEVFDIFGQSVPVYFDIGRSLLDIRHSPSGIYFVRIGESVHKLVLSK